MFEHYRVQGIPQTLVLDGKGRVVRHFTGPVKEDDLWTALRARGHEP